MTLDAHHLIYTACAHAEHAVPEDAEHDADLAFFHGSKAIGLKIIVQMRGQKPETRKRRDSSILLVCSLPQHRRRHGRASCCTAICWSRSDVGVWTLLFAA